MKRLADLKAKNEKSEQYLKKIINPTIIKAQAHKIAEYEAKKAKILDEYNHQITHRADQLSNHKATESILPMKQL
ncbi:hypothetical protein Tco_0541744, partial [Tanacetum coccineum]